MMKKYEYKFNIILDRSLNMNERMVVNKIMRVLNDERGWNKFGYKFTLTQVMPDFIITIARNSKIKEVCNFDGLSCADLTAKMIYLNYENWKYGCIKSKLSLDDYRTYMICHEVGHIIGKDHISLLVCSRGEKCPVMVQQTKGIGKCKANCWPLNYEDI